MLQLSRLIGLGLVVCAVLVMSGRWAVDEWIGYVLLLVGAAAYFAIPRTLARRWRTPER